MLKKHVYGFSVVLGLVGFKVCIFLIECLAPGCVCLYENIFMSCSDAPDIQHQHLVALFFLNN